MFSGEAMIGCDDSFGKTYYHSRPDHRQFHPRQVQQTMQGEEDKLTLWGCITFFGVGDASWIPGKIDADAYLGVVKDYVQQSRDYWDMDVATFIFQQDNARVHTARKVMEFFEEKNITLLPWPAHSPDLNPMKHIWTYTKHEQDQNPVPPRTPDELWERFQDIWVKIPKDFLQNLYESIPKRLREVIRNKGRKSDK
jgi:hypothetical protein